MPPTIIGLAGRKRSGKTTSADILTKEFGFVQLAFADPLRAVLLETDPILCGEDVGTEYRRLSSLVDELGWEGIKESKWGPELRRLMQTLGTEGARTHISPSVWVDATMNYYRTNIEDVYPFVVFTDVRFSNEAKAIRKLGGEVWEISRDDNLNDSHISERLSFRVDRTIPNRGDLESLRTLLIGSLCV